MEATGPSNETKASPQPQRQPNKRRQHVGADHNNKVIRQPPQPDKGERANGESRYQKKEGSNGKESPRVSGRNYVKKYPDQRQKKYKERQDQHQQGKETNGGDKVNERFDNAAAMGPTEQIHNPGLAHAIAESKRLQMIIPTGLPPEVVAQITRIREVIPSVEEHIIYSVLEQCNFDEQRTVSHFLEGKKRDSKEEVDGHHPVAIPGIHWTNIVKKGIPVKQAPPVFDRKKPKSQEQNGHARRPTQENSGETPEAANVDSEEIVTSLASAIEQQLRMIQQQTQMLHQMQNELLNITQNGGNEVQELSQEKVNLQQREDNLQEELRQVRERIRQIDVSLQNKEKEKKERIQTLASKSAQYGILKNKPQQH